MDRTPTPHNAQQARRDQALPAGVTAMAIALVVSSFAFLLAPLFS